MSTKPKILAFAGSLRKDSYNKKLVKIAAEAARSAGAEVAFADLADYPMPIFDQDFEQQNGLPDSVLKFRELMLAHQGLLISSPEYNSSMSGVLKNTIDWASRPIPGRPSLECFQNKVAALMSASPGALGGLRGLVHVRAMLGNINVLILPQQVAVPKANEAFGPEGSLKDAKQKDSVEALGKALTAVVSKLGAKPYEA